MSVQTPIYDLLPYQKRFLADTSRFKIGMWSRQTGKSFTSALEAVLDAAENPNRLWICLSAGERQSMEWMEKARMHAEAYGMAAAIEHAQFSASVSALRIVFPNGSRIIGLPANPNTARGYSGNVILDEFAFHENSREIWRALVPAITRGYRLVVLSTPNGRANMFYDLWMHHPEFSKHKVTIEDAVNDGLKVDVDELRAAIDPEGFQQEYMCEFVDEAGSLLTYELIASCEHEAAGADAWTDDPVYIGMDIGRKRDLTVIWAVQLVGDVFWTREVRVLEKTPFREQLETLETYLRMPQVQRCCIDATGLGAMLAEEAQRNFGEYRVEAVTFTPAAKEELAMGMLRAFQDRLVRIPPEKDIREDLHKVRKVVTAAGNVRYQAERDDAGHADRFWALALALHAGSTAGGPVVWMPAEENATRGLSAAERHPLYEQLQAARRGAARAAATGVQLI